MNTAKFNPSHVTKYGFGGLLSANIPVQILKQNGNDVLVITEGGNGWHGKTHELNPFTCVCTDSSPCLYHKNLIK